MRLTPSQKLVLTVKEFTAEYCLQFLDCKGKIVISLGTQEGEQSIYEPVIAMWHGDVVDEQGEDVDPVQLYWKQPAETMDMRWQRVVKLAYMTALDIVSEPGHFN